jgi:N-acetyl-beta-hexosaminidase
MMDYSRHFYPVNFIKHTIDAMAASKLNVLHMHITDDQSFPIEVKSVPQLTEKGAYGWSRAPPSTRTATHRGIPSHTPVARHLSATRSAGRVSSSY